MTVGLAMSTRPTPTAHDQSDSRSDYPPSSKVLGSHGESCKFRPKHIWILSRSVGWLGSGYFSPDRIMYQGSNNHEQFTVSSQALALYLAKYRPWHGLNIRNRLTVWPTWRGRSVLHVRRFPAFELYYSVGSAYVMQRPPLACRLTIDMFPGNLWHCTKYSRITFWENPSLKVETVFHWGVCNRSVRSLVSDIFTLPSGKFSIGFATLINSEHSALMFEVRLWENVICYGNICYNFQILLCILSDESASDLVKKFCI